MHASGNVLRLCATCDSTGKCVTLILLLAALAARARMARAAVAHSGHHDRRRGGSGGAGGVGGTIIGGAGGSGGTAGVGGTASAAQVEALARVVSTAVRWRERRNGTRHGGAAGGTDAMAYDAITTVEEMRSRPTRQHATARALGLQLRSGQTSRGTSSCRSFCWALRSYGR